MHTDTPAPPPDQLSSQTAAERSAQPVVQRTITLRLNLRVVAAWGAGLIVLGAFLPWLDPAAQAVLGASRLATVIHGWPSLLIGLIALGVLALSHADSPRWVSLPAAALGLAAAFIAVASAITTANALSEIVARFPDAAPVTVTGAGVFVTIAGGILCVVAGLSQPPAGLPEARLDLRPGQPAFAVLASAFVVVALAAGLIGAWLASGQPGRNGERPATFPSELLSTPVIDARVTPLGAATEPASEATIAGELPIPTPPLSTPTSTSLPTGTPPPTATGTVVTHTPSPSPTATFGQSPLPTDTLTPQP